VFVANPLDGTTHFLHGYPQYADYVYRHTAPGGTGARIPHRKLDGALVFLACEIRAWQQQTEIPIIGPQLHLVSGTTRGAQSPTRRA
jgi:hypothetical protein